MSPNRVRRNEKLKRRSNNEMIQKNYKNYNERRKKLKTNVVKTDQENLFTAQAAQLFPNSNENNAEYFNDVYNTLKEGIPNGSYAKNVIHEMKGREVHYSCHTIVSSIIEKLLPVLKPADLENFSKSVSQDLKIMFSEETGVRVMETLLNILSKRVTDSLEISEKIYIYFSSHIKFCKKFIMNICGFVWLNFEKYINDKNAHVIVRCCISILTGLRESKSDISRTFNTVPVKWQQLAKTYCDSLLSLKKFPDLASQTSCSTIEAFLCAFTQIDQIKQQKLIIRLVDTHFCQTSVDKYNKTLNICLSAVSLKLFYATIEFANQQSFDYIYDRCFKRDIQILSTLPNGFNLVQRLIDHCKTKYQFKTIMKKLAPIFGKIMVKKNCSVIASLAKGCKQFCCCQLLFVKSISEALNYDDNSSVKLPLLIVSFRTPKEAEKSKFITFYPDGIKILKEMLYFKNTFNVEDLLILFYEPVGSTIAEILLKIETLEQETYKIITDSMLELAVSKYGSKVVKILWQNSNTDQRNEMKTKMLSHVELLNSTEYGQEICKEFDV